MNILILGAGSIGCFLGGTLAAHGQSVTLVGRWPLMQKIAADGLTLIHPNRAAETTKPKTVIDLAQLSSPFDFILLTVKNPAVASAIEQLTASALNLEKTQIVSFQNGLGSEELLATAFGSTKIIAGTITIPIRVLEPGTIEISKPKGGLGLAPLQPNSSVKPLAEMFNHAGLPTVVYDDYRAMKWSKLLLNITNNAISAILNQSPAQIIARNDLFDLEIEALQESVVVIKAQHLKIVKLPGYPTNLLGHLLEPRWLPRFVSRAILRPAMRSGRGNKMPSLQIDLADGRATSEIEALNGAVVQAGQKFGVATPVNQVLTELVRGLFSGSLAWRDYQNKPEKLLEAVAMNRKAIAGS